MANPVDEKLLSALSAVVMPLVHADGGELYLVSGSAEEVHVHLAGTCAGCPGANFTQRHLIEPAVASVFAKASLKVTTGFRIPPGANRVGGADALGDDDETNVLPKRAGKNGAGSADERP